MNRRDFMHQLTDVNRRFRAAPAPWAWAAFGLFLAAVAHAAPFLTCTPYAPNSDTGLNIVTFVITGNIPGSPVSVTATVGTSGSQNLYYDLATLSNNTYTVTAAAVNGYGLESAQSTPFTFTKGIPSTPVGLSIVPSIPNPVP